MAKEKIGRPTEYDPKYCKVAYDLLAAGKSILHVAREIGVARSTLYDWKDKHQEFRDTLEVGKDHSEAFWLDEVAQMARNKEVNAPLIKLLMSRMFKWSDKVQTDHISSDKSMSPKAPVEIKDAEHAAQVYADLTKNK